jgi:ferric-dicitrate binding protein FerR (iron transport regulator)
MNHSLSKHNLFSYLAGQANPLERQVVEEWLKNPANTDTFHTWLLEWENRSLQFIPDQETAFEKLMQRLDKVEAPEELLSEEPVRSAPFYLRGCKPYLVAATILISLSLAFSPVRNTLLYRNYQTVAGQVKTIHLQDGTNVRLKPNSSLQVPRFGFQNDVRQVLLTGEGRFSVTHQKNNQRFVVKTSDRFQVEVLGTEFTVYARQKGTKVVLDRGKIRIDYNTASKKERVIMKPGEMVTLSQQGAFQLRKLAPVKTLIAQKEHLFLFRNTSLWEACYLLDEHFGLKVGITDDSLAHRTISGDFRANSANELLDLLMATSNLRIDSTGNALLLKDNQ